MTPQLFKTLLFLFFLTLQSAWSNSPRPNIVFILADDLGWADTTLYGHTRFYQTPNLERLAKRGMTFTRAYAASPLCSPTRASILTGQNPARLGLTSPTCHLPEVQLKARPGGKTNPGLKARQPKSATRLRTDIPTLGKTLRKAGYQTGHFGKWHLGPEPYSPLQQGFQIDVPHWHGPGPKGSYLAPWSYPDFDPAHPKEHIEDRMAEEAVAFLEKHKDTPFFLNYWQFSVHAPFDAKKELIEKHRKRIDPKSPQRSPTYAAMVESMDDAVGTLLDALDRLELTDNTIIIFFSDNGGNMYNTVDDTTPTSNAPLRGGKATMFEGGVRVPMIVSYPGTIRSGTTNESLVQSTDFYPTLVELLGLQTEKGQVFDGSSIVPALKGEALRRPPIFTYFPHNPPVPDWIPPAISVHQDEWKLIREFHQGKKNAHRYRLFNLKTDLGERENLAGKHPKKVKALDQLITTFLKETKAIVPVPNPDFNPSKYQPEREGKGMIRQAKKKPRPKSSDPFDPKLEGWKVRNANYQVDDGILKLKPTGADPFLGTGAKRFDSSCRFSFRIKATSTGPAKITWSNESGSDRKMTFQLKGGAWNEQTLTINPEKDLGIFRIHLPKEAGPYLIDYLKLSAEGNEAVADFKPPFRKPNGKPTASSKQDKR
jgi:arylsulfatase A-like enzyme